MSCILYQYFLEALMIIAAPPFSRSPEYQLVPDILNTHPPWTYCVLCTDGLCFSTLLPLYQMFLSKYFLPVPSRSAWLSSFQVFSLVNWKEMLVYWTKIIKYGWGGGGIQGGIEEEEVETKDKKKEWKWREQKKVLLWKWCYRENALQSKQSIMCASLPKRVFKLHFNSSQTNQNNKTMWRIQGIRVLKVMSHNHLHCSFLLLSDFSV